MCVCARAYVRTYVCACMGACMWVCACMWVWVCVCMVCTCMCMCVYIHRPRVYQSLNVDLYCLVKKASYIIRHTVNLEIFAVEIFS